MNMKFKEFFKVTSFEDIPEHLETFSHLEKETVLLENGLIFSFSCHYDIKISPFLN